MQGSAIMQKQRNKYAKALEDRRYRNRVVRQRKGKAAYQRNKFRDRQGT
jgi:stalled ribosome alternative rescue factor ArfA